jgi:ribonuclease HI
MEKIVAYTDGGARGNPGPAGAGASILDKEGAVLREVMQFLGNGTNNFAEYQAVILALTTLKEMFGKKTREMDFEIRMDSELVQKQLSGLYQIKEPSLVPQFLEVHNLCVSHFPHITFTHVRREENKRADELANQAMDTK